jgi:homoserine dehydrogenase
VTRAPLRVAVLGAGTVGREVVRGLARLAHLAPIELVGIAVRDVERARARGLPADLLTDAPAHLVASPDTDAIVELMGGDEPAHTLVAAALGAGKAVVSANKHVVAHHGASLEAIARRTGAQFRFEAAVGGGIPVLGPLAADLAANRVTRVRGIVNGTTNHILSAMATDGRTYEAVLREAQELGYAEADPSGDVGGHDAMNKIVILARLAFGAWVDPTSVRNRPPSIGGDGGPGITGVTADELSGAAAVGLTLRLLAAAARPRPDGPLGISVVPTALPSTSPLGAIGGVRNRIEVDGDLVGSVGFDGPGAGGAATSSAVLGDLLAVARGAGSTWAALPPATPLAASAAGATGAVRDNLDGTRPWFLLIRGDSAPSLTRGVADAAASVPGGLAVRTKPITLAALRRRVVDSAPRLDGTPCYPVDDR